MVLPFSCPVSRRRSRTREVVGELSERRKGGVGGGNGARLGRCRVRCCVKIYVFSRILVSNPSWLSGYINIIPSCVEWLTYVLVCEASAPLDGINVC